MITDNHCTHCISNSSSEHSYKDYILHGIKNLDDVSIESLVCNKNITQFDTNIIDKILSKKRSKIGKNNKEHKEHLLSVCNVESIIISNKELKNQFQIANDIEYNYQSEAINNYFGEKEEKNLLVPSKEVEYSYNIKQDLLYKVERVYGTIIDKKLVISSTPNALEDLENKRNLNERNKMSKEDFNVSSNKEQERTEMLKNDININEEQKNECIEEMKKNDFNALEYYRINRERVNLFENDVNAITKFAVHKARREMKLNDYNVLSIKTIKQERSAMEKNDINIIEKSVKNESIDRHSEENQIKEVARKDDIPSSNEVVSDTVLGKTKNNISCNNESIEHSINSEMFNDTNNIEEEEKKEIKIEKVQEFEIEADIMKEENKENKDSIIQQSMHDELNDKENEEEDNVKNNEEMKDESIVSEIKDLIVKKNKEDKSINNESINKNNTHKTEEEKIIDDIQNLKENEKQENNVEEVNRDTNKENSNIKEKEENIPNKEEIKEDNKEVPLNERKKTEENFVNDIQDVKENSKLEDINNLEEINNEQMNENLNIKVDEEKNIPNKEEVIEDNQLLKKKEEEQKNEPDNENEKKNENKNSKQLPLNELKKTEEEHKDEIINEKEPAKKEESNENVLLYNEPEESPISKHEAQNQKENSKINEQIKREDNNSNQKKEVPIEVENISNIKTPRLEVGIQADINSSKSSKSIQVSIIKEEQKNENVTTTKNKEKKNTRHSKIQIDSERKPVQELNLSNQKKEVPNQIFTQDIKNEIENVENENTIEDNSLKILLNDSVPDLNSKKKWSSQILNKPSGLLEKKIRFQPTTLTSQNNSLYSKNIIQNSSVISKHSKSIKLNHIEENNEDPIQKDVTQEASSNKILIEKSKIQKLLKKVNTSKTPLLQTIPVPEQESLYQLHKAGSKQKYKKHHGTIENCSICQAKLKENINKEIENNNNISNQKINHSIICAHRTKLSKPQTFKRNANYNSFFHFENGSVLKMKKSSSTSNMLTTGITQKQFEKNAKYYKSMMQDRTNPYSIYCTEKIYGPRTSRKGRLVLSGKSTSVGKRTLGSGEWKMWNDFSTNENSMMRNDYAQYPVIYKYFHY